MRRDLRIAALMVKDGSTFQQVATALNLTRNQVAGACWRAGVKGQGRPPGDFDSTPAGRQRATRAVNIRWARYREQSMSK